jgi:hypothetical protein
MFSDEFAVTYPPTSIKDWQKSVFVPRAFVREVRANQGDVLVNVFVEEGKRYAVLPSAERDIVQAEDADLQPR